MSESATAENLPPKLRPGREGGTEPSSIADLVEWFLNYDERTARIRHTNTEELFQWKQQDDQANGVGTYPFENAEARFAIGVFQALQENNSEPLLGLWLNDVLAALHEREKNGYSIRNMSAVLGSKFEPQHHLHDLRLSPSHRPDADAADAELHRKTCRRR